MDDIICTLFKYNKEFNENKRMLDSIYSNIIESNIVDIQLNENENDMKEIRDIGRKFDENIILLESFIEKNISQTHSFALYLF